MKSWTILALLVAVCAVFLGFGHTEETADDFKEAALEDVYSDTENDVQLENTLESVNETPSNDDDEPEMFKRAPWGRRRGGWGRRRRRRGGWGRRLWNTIHHHARRVCHWVKDVPHHTVRRVCRWINGDEEYPRVLKDEIVITAQEADDLVKQGWLKEE